MRFALIAAVTSGWGIGNKGGLPWKSGQALLADMAFFSKLTSNQIHFNRETGVLEDTNNDESNDSKRQRKARLAPAVIMGRSTWESIPQKFRPLPDRLNVVMTSRDMSIPEGTIKAASLKEALEATEESPYVYVIGGERAYEESLTNPNCDLAFLTLIEPFEDPKNELAIDTFFPRETLEKRLEERVDITRSVWRIVGPGILSRKRKIGIYFNAEKNVVCESVNRPDSEDVCADKAGFKYKFYAYKLK